MFCYNLDYQPEKIKLTTLSFIFNSIQNPDKIILPIVVPDSSFLCALHRFSAFIGDNNTSVKVLFILLLSIRSARKLISATSQPALRSKRADLMHILEAGESHWGIRRFLQISKPSAL